MQFRRKLRSRIIISFLLFGTLLSGIFVVSAILTRDYLESQYVGVQLLEQLSRDLQFTRDKSTPGGSDDSEFYPFEFVQGWMVKPYQVRTLPEIMHDLPSGVHNLTTEEGSYVVAVLKEPDLWGYLQYNVSWNQSLERLAYGILGAVIIGFSLLSFLLAVWSSKRIMSPVTDLARRIRKMGDVGHPEALRQYYADDEVGELAKALDAFAERLTSMVERDEEFNADVSHELRTPLAVISSATELLLGQSDLSDKTRIRLGRIERASMQSTELTTALLHLVRHQKMEDMAEECHDIAGIVEAVVEANKPLLGRKRVDVNIQVDQAFNVCASRAVIFVALNNLIGNAFKYTQEGTVNVVIDGGKVSVDDTGPGMPEAELAHVFERYYRGKKATGKGSGIGLAIVSRLCDLYGWRISIDNAPHGGLLAMLEFQEQ